MGSSYLKNHLGFSLSEEQFEDIPHPTTELLTHVTLKTVQAGAILGGLVFGPIRAVVRSTTRNLDGIIKTGGRYGRNGMMIGLVLGPVFTFLKARTLTTQEVIDRDYRLRHNRGQVRVDRASIVGAVLGSGAFLARNRCPLTGIVYGMSTGILVMAVYNSKADSHK